MRKKKVSIVATGGTIAGSSNGFGYDSGVISIQQLVSAIPQLEELAELEVVQFCNVGSQDMDFTCLQSLAIFVQNLCERVDIDGVVVTHGTDTMEESSFYLDLLVDTTKPVIFTGSMRPASSLSSDGPLNIYNAVVAAVSSKLENCGVLVAMNGVIHTARSVQKRNTCSVETFISSIGLSAGVIQGKDVILGEVFHKKTHLSGMFRTSVSALPRVDIFYFSTDVNPDLIEFSVSQGAKGIVLAGVGNGNVSESVIAVCKRMISQGIVIVRASRVPTGPVIRNLEINDDHCGFIVAGNYSPQKARVLLAVSLGAKVPISSLQNIFY